MRPVSIGDFVWEDRDGEGDQDPGEPGLPNVDVTLYAAGADPRQAQPLGEVTTDATGRFLLAPPNGVAPNTCYRVALRMTNNQQLGSTLFPTVRTANGAAGVPNDSNGALGFGDQFTTADVCTGAAGTSRLDIDFGLVPAIELGDRVWLDENGDGEQDQVDGGVKDIRVRLWRQNALGERTQVCNTLTDNEGKWKLSSVDASCQALLKPSNTDLYVLAIKRDQFPERRSTIRDAAIAGDEADSDARPQLTPPNDDELIIERRITEWGVIDMSLDFGLVRVLEVTTQTNEPSSWGKKTHIFFFLRSLAI